MIQITERPNGMTLVRIDDARLTAAIAPDFKQRMADAVEAGHNRLVLDLSRVTFIDSTGLGALVGVLKRIGNRGDLAVCGLQPAVQQMFKLTRMDRVFRIFPDAETALASLQ
jgi:anti-sigma B factor antagonist